MTTSVRVLHVEDEPGLQEVLDAYLADSDTEMVIETASNGKEGLHRCRQKEFGCIISDYNMPNMDGIEMFRALRQEEYNVPFIFYTSSETIEEKIEENSGRPPKAILRKGRDGFDDILETVNSIARATDTRASKRVENS
jgi:CheY-like chemotaxis protein